MLKESDIMDSGSGSDSDPTQDNFDVVEFEKVMPASFVKFIPKEDKKDQDDD